jgi:hypothetical protein
MPELALTFVSYTTPWDTTGGNRRKPAEQLFRTDLT